MSALGSERKCKCMLTILGLGVALFILITAGIAGLSAAPWLPTRGRDVGRMLDLAEVRAGDVVYDLGCGDGRLLAAATRRGATAIGIELSFLPWLVAWLRSWRHPGMRVIFGNLFKLDISDATVVCVFLLPKSYDRLQDKFNRQLRPGTRVIVGCWPIEGWTPHVRSKPSERDLPIYSYLVDGH